LFITLEGPDGSGKTTQAHLLVEWLEERDYPVVLTREPGGTDIGDQIRAVLHDPENAAMDPRTEILLYSADRAQHVAQVIRPALTEGKIVISDRYADSTIAYQGYGRQLDLEMLRTLTLFATGGLTPDLTIYFDILPEEGLQRRLQNKEEWNRLDGETLAFHRRVRAGYLEMIRQDPARWTTIDAARSVDTVKGDVQERVRRAIRAEAI